ncbi:MAG: hypothetical protein QW561_00110 [Candidatus Aenigmatarchaeota archaeon]
MVMLCTLSEYRRVTGQSVTIRWLQQKAARGKLDAEVVRRGKRYFVFLTDQEQILKLSRLRVLKQTKQTNKKDRGRRKRYAHVVQIYDSLLLGEDSYRDLFFNFILKSSDTLSIIPEPVYLPENVAEKLQEIAKKNNCTVQIAFEKMLDLFKRSKEGQLAELIATRTDLKEDSYDRPDLSQN